MPIGKVQARGQAPVLYLLQDANGEALPVGEEHHELDGCEFAERLERLELVVQGVVKEHLKKTKRKDEAGSRGDVVEESAPQKKIQERFGRDGGRREVAQTENTNSIGSRDGLMA